MQALEAQDRDAFVAVEMAEREAAGLPPFGRLAAVIVSGRDAAALEAFVRALAAAAPNAEGVEVYGPADAPLALVRGRRRKRFLVRADRNVDLQAFIAAWRARVKAPARCGSRSTSTRTAFCETSGRWRSRFLGQSIRA